MVEVKISSLWCLSPDLFISYAYTTNVACDARCVVIRFLKNPQHDTYSGFNWPNFYFSVVSVRVCGLPAVYIPYMSLCDSIPANVPTISVMKSVSLNRPSICSFHGSVIKSFSWSLVRSDISFWHVTVIRVSARNCRRRKYSLSMNDTCRLFHSDTRAIVSPVVETERFLAFPSCPWDTEDPATLVANRTVRFPAESVRTFTDNGGNLWIRLGWNSGNRPCQSGGICLQTKKFKYNSCSTITPEIIKFCGPLWNPSPFSQSKCG